MASLSKNQKENLSKIKEGSKYKISDALALVKECATAKFDESVDVSINLGIDTKKSDQTVRGALVLPNGTGKVSRVAVFTQGDNVQKATDAGADIVGMDDLMKAMQDGDLNYDVVIASPDAMGVVGRLGFSSNAKPKSWDGYTRRCDCSKECKGWTGSLSCG